jgi:hypothetical protein
MRIEPPGASLTFTARLAREQGWSVGRADTVMEEYRRFLYLAATGARPMTPSEDVDAAWHLHLTYTRHYWDELCGNILGCPLHHDPTEGGRAQLAHFIAQYEATLARYHDVFGHAPPADIWPEAEVRFAGKSPPRWPRLAAAGIASMSLAACTAVAGEWGAGAIVLPIVVAGLLVLLLVTVIVRAAQASRRSRDDGSGGGDSGGAYASSDCGPSDSCGDGGSSGCGGGCGGGD